METATKVLTAFGGPILVFLAGISASVAAFRIWRTYGQYWRPMRRLTNDWLHEVALPDGPDGDTLIEHVALLPDGFLVVKIMDFSGAIFGATNMDYWTQVLNRRSYRFPNPTEELKATTGAVRAVVGDEQVIGHIVFSNLCSFPKGVPDGVSSARDLNFVLEEHCLGLVPESRRIIWEDLKRQVSVPRLGDKSGSYSGNWNRFVFRAILASGLVLSSIVWTGWLMLRFYLNN